MVPGVRDFQFERNQDTVRRGDGDYIKLHNGKLALVRSFQPDGTMKLSKIGKQFYKDRHAEYVIEIPVIIRCYDSKGRARERREHLPVNEMGLGRFFAHQGLSAAEAFARVKNQVLARLGGVTRLNRTVLMEFSGQEFIYDRDGTWLISAMQTTVSADGVPHTEVRMHRDLGDPMRGLSSASHLPHEPDLFLDEAFEEHADAFCVPRQLAALLRRPMDNILESFDEMLRAGVCRE